MDRRLLEFAEELGGPFLLSDFLTWFGSRVRRSSVATVLPVRLDDLQHLETLADRPCPEAGQRGSSSISRLPVRTFPTRPSDSNSERRQRLFPRIEFQIQLLDRNEENYTRETDRSE